MVGYDPIRSRRFATQSNAKTRRGERWGGRKPFLEALESRTLLSSTLFVTTTIQPDATHFPSLQAALAAANAGDTIQLQSSLSPGIFTSTVLTQSAAAGSTSLHTAAALDVGDIITLNGGNYERALITAFSQVGPGDYLLSLATPLLLSHSGAVDASNNPTIGLAKGVTLTADPGVTLPFNLEIWNAPASSSITLSALDLGTHSLAIDGSSSTISACTLAQVVVQSGVHATAFLNNTFNIPTGDGLALDNADNTVLTGNTFNLASDASVALTVHNSANVLILSNTITTGFGGTGIFVSADETGASTVDIRNNAIATTDGTGVFLAKFSTTAALEARLQGNNLRYNAMDVTILGDGTSAGNIDLGGGATVFGTSTGGNNFMGKSNLSLSANNFAIGLFNTGPTFLVRAGSNVFATGQFSFPNALGLVVDSLHQVPDADGTGLILVTTTSLAPETLTATAAPITVADSAFSGTLASFSSNLSRDASAFTAVIDWGDGTSSRGVITGDDLNGYLVTGDHVWTSAGDFNVITVIESSAAFALVSAPADMAPVITRSLAIQPVNVSALQYDAFTGSVATFTDTQAATTPADYTASIVWSDGLTTAGVISANADGSFSISTSRTFTAGNLTATVSLATAGNQFTASTAITATVTPRALTLTGTNIALVQSATFTGIVASFTDNKAGTSSAAYVASIAWSDGLVTPGTIVAKANGSFSVSTSRAFPDPGNVTATVTVSTLAGLVSASTPISAAVAPRTITLDALNFTYPKNKSFTAVVATFTDNLPGTVAASYVVSVKWSDNLTTPATVSRKADGSFAITTTRTFSKTGIVVASITVATTDGLFTGTVNVTGTITNQNDKVPPGHNRFALILMRIRQLQKIIKGCSHK
jgi:hypothetical protein